MADLLVQDEGSIYLLRPTTRQGFALEAQHIGSNETSLGGTVVVEHGYIRDIVVGPTRVGLKVH